jgi:hypothetical protein
MAQKKKVATGSVRTKILAHQASSAYNKKELILAEVRIIKLKM